MFNKISCIHIAVNSVDEAVKQYEDNFGISSYNHQSQEATGVKSALLAIGDAVIEFIEPLVPGTGPVAKFLEKRGEGVYMTAMEVDDMESTVAELKAKGIPLINDTPEAKAQGVPVFIHPKAAKGLMIELIEKSE